LYNAVDLSADRSAGLARQQYDESISKAYNSAYSQSGVINSSNLGSGFKEALSSDVENSLKQAYESYRNTYASSLSSIEQQASSAIKSIDDELLLQSKNTKSYIDSIYDYLSDLYIRSKGSEDGKILQDEYLNNLFTNDPLWKRWTTAVTDESGAEIGRSLIDKNTLLNELYDAEGNINEQGRDFYNQMMYSLGTSDGVNYSYGKYLSENKPELLEWATSTNLQGVSNYDMVRGLLGISDANTSNEIDETGKTDGTDNTTKGKHKENRRYAEDGQDGRIDESVLRKYNGDYYSVNSKMDSLVGTIAKYGLKDAVASDLGMSLEDYLESVSKDAKLNANSKAAVWANNYIERKYRTDVSKAISTPSVKEEYDNLLNYYLKYMPSDPEYMQSQYDRLRSIVEKYIYSK
jgi:hypothetical protein